MKLFPGRSTMAVLALVGRCTADYRQSHQTVTMGSCTNSINLTYEHQYSHQWYYVTLVDGDQAFHDSASNYDTAKKGVMEEYERFLRDHSHCYDTPKPTGAPTSQPTGAPTPKPSSRPTQRPTVAAATIAHVPSTSHPRIRCSFQVSHDCDDAGTLTIPSGERCEIHGARIRGSIRMEEGAVLEVRDSRVESNLFCNGCRSVSIYDSEHIESVTMMRPIGGGLFIEKSQIVKTVQVTQASERFPVHLINVRPVVSHNDTRVSGADVIIEQSQLDYVRIEEETALGRVVLVQNEVTGTVFVGGGSMSDPLTIGSDLYIQNNAGPMQFRYIRAARDLMVTSNQDLVVFDHAEFPMHDVTMTRVPVEVRGNLVLPDLQGANRHQFAPSNLAASVQDNKVASTTLQEEGSLSPIGVIGTLFVVWAVAAIVGRFRSMPGKQGGYVLVGNQVGSVNASDGGDDDKCSGENGIPFMTGGPNAGKSDSYQSCGAAEESAMRGKNKPATVIHI